jgi:hypothetical protein
MQHSDFAIGKSFWCGAYQWRCTDIGTRVITAIKLDHDDYPRWRDQELRSRNLPDHVFEHLLTMARLHAANRYDRLTHDVEAITGRPATGIREFVTHHVELFGQSSLPEKVSGAS